MSFAPVVRTWGSNPSKRVRCERCTSPYRGDGLRSFAPTRGLRKGESMSESENSGLSRIDWDQAFIYYAELGPSRSFGKVAKYFGVSDVAVGLHAREHFWRRRAAEIDQKARGEAEKRIVRERAKRLADTLTLIDKARSEVLAQLEKGDADVKISDLPALIKLELLLEGEATDRVEIVEVRQVIQQVFAVVGEIVIRWVPAAERGEALAMIDRAAGLVALDPHVEEDGTS
jgi:hypothetical protein